MSSFIGHSHVDVYSLMIAEVYNVWVYSEDLFPSNIPMHSFRNDENHLKPGRE